MECRLNSDTSISNLRNLDSVLACLVVDGASGDAKAIGHAIDVAILFTQDLFDVVALDFVQRAATVRDRGCGLRGRGRKVKRSRIEHLAMIAKESALEDVSELADVTRPVVAAKCLLAVRADGDELLTEVARKSIEQDAGDERNVVAPLPQGWHA